MVMVDGRVVVEAGPGPDDGRGGERRGGARLAEPLGRRAAAAFWQLDGPNARSMRAGKL